MHVEGQETVFPGQEDLMEQSVRTYEMTLISIYK